MSFKRLKIVSWKMEHQVRCRIEDVEKIPLQDLKSLLEEPNVQTVMSNLESSQRKGKKKLHNADIVPGGPGAQELLELLDESMLEELDELKTKIKEKDIENEKLNQTHQIRNNIQG